MKDSVYMGLTLIETAFMKECLEVFFNQEFHYVSIGYQRSKKDPIYGFFTHKEWMNHYRENALFIDDPLLEISDQFKDQEIIWDMISLNTKKKASIMQQRYSLANVKNGLTISTVTKCGVRRVLALGVKEDQLTLLKKYSDFLPSLKAMYEDMDTHVIGNFV
jgi:hypothetical protein